MLTAKMEIIRTTASRLNGAVLEEPGFGRVFSDHMFSLEYSGGQWREPRIMPFGDIAVSPAICSLHYGQAVFEGLKAFYSADGGVNIFRPRKYHERLVRSSRRLCIPELSWEVFIEGLMELLRLDNGWVPRKKGQALYIRPFIFATDSFLGVNVSDSYRFLIITSPVGAYFKEGMNPVKLTTPGEYVRAARGGLGAVKTPANYAASLLPAYEAKKKGFTQVLWLDGAERRYIEEVGTMNIFFLLDNELVTPALEGSVLAGVTRDSVIELARDWGVKVAERRISIDEVFSLAGDGKVREVFGAGTAAVISPVGEIWRNGDRIVINNNETGRFSRRLYDHITAIQYGEIEDRFGWRHPVAER